jgi:C-terminal processing protease CtpA/Prc
MSDRTSPRPLQDDAVSLDLDNAVTVAEFLEQRRQLTFDECLALVNEAILLLEGLYVHLPVKRAMYAVDPVRRLRLLKLRLERYHDLARRMAQGETPRAGEQAPPTDDLWFHREMADTLTSLRDLHTMYVLPEPFDRAVAFVPFQIEGYFMEDEHKYLVANVIDGPAWFRAPADFVPGVEVTHFNDIPMPRAVELAGARNAGSNPDARLARGLARLTIRPLAKALPPDEEWVTVRYRPGPGQVGDWRVPWRVVLLDAAEPPPPDGSVILDRAEGLDYETDIIRTLTRHLYVPSYSRSPRKWSPRKRSPRSPGQLRGGSAKRLDDIAIVTVDERMRDIIQAKTFGVASRRYGHIRLRTFKVDDEELFLKVFSDLLEDMPEHGLILDIRDNPGGYIQTGEQLLQLLTPRTIAPETAQFINTPLSLAVCDALPTYRPWRDSIRRAVETGTTYSQAYPLTDVEACNRIGQRYYGPVILVTNALCYSTADIFAAGFQDHTIGKVLGTEGSTGAGGANVVSHSDLTRRFTKAQAAEGNTAAPGGRLTRLPVGDLRLAIRRTLRIGERAGAELEDLGVIPDIPYRMSRDDLLNQNIDLLMTAVAELAKAPSYRLRELPGSVRRAVGAVTATVETRNLARLDLAVDGWASASQPVADGCGEVRAACPPTALGEVLELRGFDAAGSLVAARKILLS